MSEESLNIMRGEVEVRPSLQHTVKLKFSTASLEFFEAHTGTPITQFINDVNNGVVKLQWLRVLMQAGTQHRPSPLTADRVREMLDSAPFADADEVLDGRVHSTSVMLSRIVTAALRFMPGVSKANFILQAQASGFTSSDGLPQPEPEQKPDADSPTTGS